MAMRRSYHRVGFTAAQSAELWERWRRGEGLKAIGRVFGKPSSCIFNHIRPSGGIRPAARRRGSLALTLAEREEISRGLVAGRTVRSLAATLGRSPSTVSREITRNGGSRQYRAAAADKRAWKRALRPKPCKLALHDQLRQAVEKKLQQNWSPEQIAGWLKRTNPGSRQAQVSHETIYRSLYVQARGVLKKELQQFLRTHRPIRRSRHSSQKADQRGRIANAVSIRQRPAEAEDRAVPGHWEGDLLSGANNTHIATLVERHSRFTMLLKVPNKNTATVVDALARHIGKLPQELRRSLTWDRGKEMAAHKRFTVATNVRVYFCDPRSPWQRGTNENTNGLLRQYFPKGTDLSSFSQAYLNRIALRLNQRPRKTLGFETPADKLGLVLP